VTATFGLRTTRDVRFVDHAGMAWIEEHRLQVCQVDDTRYGGRGPHVRPDTACRSPITAVAVVSMPPPESPVYSPTPVPAAVLQQHDRTSPEMPRTVVARARTAGPGTVRGMDEGVGPTIGERIAQLRGTSMNPKELGAASGVAVDVIRRLEQGRRHTVSIGTVQRLARALDVDAADLLSATRSLPDPGELSGAVAIRRALTRVDDLIGDEPDFDPITLDVARLAVTNGWGACRAGRYELLGYLLPTAIGQLRATVRQAPTAEAFDLAAQIHQIAAYTLVPLGYADAAHLALREALTLAAGGSDPLRAPALRGTLAWVLLTQGRFAESHRLAAATAAALGTSVGSELPLWSLYGSLLLTGANAIARAGDRPAAVKLLDEATEVAGRTGNRNDYELAFGPDQVLMQAVDVDVVSGNYAAALATAEEMPKGPALPVAARARHLSDVAMAHVRLGHDSEALEALLAMERIAPTWTRYQTQPRQIVHELRERAANPRHLTNLAWRLGLVTRA
jgi:transcriptional regulator with XRE-family HTH domain